tara:strand:- start:34101 stop:34970 length:870 start_codon:yes stop_codon:yes gene_type:complete
LKSDVKKANDSILRRRFSTIKIKMDPVDDFKGVVSWRVLDPQTKYRTGDILLFSGSGWASLVIKTFTASIWSHIGMVCWVEMTYRDGRTKVDLFSFELGSCDYVDLMTGLVANKRVRIVKLSTIAKMYDLITVRKLNLPDRNAKEARAWARRFQKFAWSNRQKPFFDLNVMLSNHFISSGGADVKQTTCSQLAANMLLYMGVYKHDFDTSQVQPGDFSSHKNSFPMRAGTPILYGKEIIIYKDHAKIRRRLGWIILIIVVLVLIVIYILVRVYRRKKARREWKEKNMAI